MMDVEILAGLPARGDPPLQFSLSGTDTHREGVVVRVATDATTWTGNFQPGNGALTIVARHPTAAIVVVVAGGTLYVVHADSKALVRQISHNVDGVLHVEDPPSLVFSDNFQLIVLGGTDVGWKTKRISWDGIRDLRAERGIVHGEAFDVTTDVWRPFEVDLRSRSVFGGCEIR